MTDKDDLALAALKRLTAFVKNIDDCCDCDDGCAAWQSIEFRDEIKAAERAIKELEADTKP